MVRIINLIKRFIGESNFVRLSEPGSLVGEKCEYSRFRTQFRGEARVTPLIPPAWEAAGAAERFLHTLSTDVDDEKENG